MNWWDLSREANLVGGIIHSNDSGHITRGIIGAISVDNNNIVHIFPMGGRLLRLDEKSGNWNFEMHTYSGWSFLVDESSTPEKGKEAFMFHVTTLGSFKIYPLGAAVPVR